MSILLTIVYRNLREHKIKTLIIGIIVALGMFVLMVGNSVIDTVTAGISANFIEYNTGHVAVFPAEVEQPSLVGGGPEMLENRVPPTIDDYRAVVEAILANRSVVAVNPQMRGIATLQFNEEGSGFAQLLGVDPELYREFFADNLTFVEGSFLTPGEEGIVLSSDAAETLEESSGEAVHVGDKLIVTGTSEISGTKVREVPVVGIYRVEVASQMMTSFLDTGNMRILIGLTGIGDLAASLTAIERESLGNVDEDSLFGEGDDFITVGTSDEGGGSGLEAFTIPGPGDAASVSTVDPDAWHHLLVRLDDESSIRRGVRELNSVFEESGLAVRAYTWLDAAGQVAELTAAIRLVFNLIIAIIAVVAVIIIMNTLVISVTERIAEIGTMRAMGAQKSFVRRMIILETIIIVALFGGIGLLTGLATIGAVRAAGIETQSLILQMLAGGSRILPVVRFRSIVVSVVGMAGAGVLASLYPASLALRVEPRQAMAAM